MAQIKPRKKSVLEDPEEIRSLQLRLLAYLSRQWKWLVAAAVLAALLLGAWGLNSQLQARREDKAGEALAQVRPILSKPDKAAEAVTALHKLMEEYPSTAAAREAALFRAHLLFQQQKYVEAAKAYEALPRQDPALNLLIAESLSYCYEALGDYRKAAATLQPLADQPKSERADTPFQNEVWRRLALLFEKGGEPKEALIYWRKLLEQSANPSMAPYLKEKVAALEAASPQKP